MKNKKLLILAILIIVSIFVWIPKGKSKKRVSPNRTSVSAQKARLRQEPAQRKRSEFVEWGVNPFIWQRTEGPDAILDLNLSGIIWDKELPYAIINNTILHEQDTIAGMVVKRIEPDKVILTDGFSDCTLILK